MKPYTLEELKQVVQAMTKGEWAEDGIRGKLVNVWVPSATEHVAVCGDWRDDGVRALDDARGIVALHNLFPAVVRLVEEMRKALEASHKIVCHAIMCNMPITQAVADARNNAVAALAAADKPLECL